MNTVSVPGEPLDVSPGTTRHDVLWYHAAFCRLALPTRSAKGAWSREADGTSVSIEPGGPDGSVPSGKALRLLLLRICDAATRTRSAVLPVGDGPRAWASELGLDPSAAELRDLSVQLERLVSSRVLIAADGGPALAVFDARSRPRDGGMPWGSSLRLNNRFLASLEAAAVPLGRDIVRGLWRSPETLDAHAWAAEVIRRGDGGMHVAGWDELKRRFGQASRDPAAFRTAFGAALQAVAAADPSMLVTTGDDGVEVRRAGADATQPLLRPVPVMPDDAGARQAAQESVEAVAAPARPAIPTDRVAVIPPAEGGADVGDRPHPEAAAAPRGTPLLDPVRLSFHQTGVPGAIWLRRGDRGDGPLVGITPGGRLDPARLTVLTVEPMVLQVEGGIPERDFARAQAWIMANRDLIDDVWDGRVGSREELDARVQGLRPPAWR